jgi:hypothetical protein
MTWSVNKVVAQSSAKCTTEELQRREESATGIHSSKVETGLDANRDPSEGGGEHRVGQILRVSYRFRLLKDIDIRVYSSILPPLCSVNKAWAPNALMEANPAKAAFTEANTGACVASS